MAEEEPPFKRRKGKEIVQPTNTIEFKLKPAGVLQESLVSLIDTAFNPLCIAMVEITSDGFRLTVRNEQTHVAATLFFNSYNLVNFHCAQPLLPHMMVLGELAEFVTNVRGNKSIKIYHIDGSVRPRLIFKVNHAELQVDLMKVVTDPQRFPVRMPTCKAPITTTVLTEIIKRLEKQPRNLVILEVKRKVVIISVGEAEHSSKWVRWEIDSVAVETERGMEHHAMFKLPHLEAIRKASLIDPEPVLYLESQPERIMMQFYFVGHCEVIFLVKADMVATAPDLDSPRDDASEASQPIGDTAEASQPGGGAVEASLLEGGAAEVSQLEGGAVEASRREGG